MAVRKVFGEDCATEFCGGGGDVLRIVTKKTRVAVASDQTNLLIISRLGS